MKTFVSGICLLFASVFALPNSASAQTFSNADITGCYVLPINGTAFDPSSPEPEDIFTAATFRVCMDGNGTVIWFTGTENVAGCFAVTVTIDLDQSNTYLVNTGGNGGAIINTTVDRVVDQCGGAFELPIEQGQSVRYIFTVMLDGDLNLHTVLTTRQLPATPGVPAVPSVASGRSYRQSQ
jgi:hypothetical protein